MRLIPDNVISNLRALAAIVIAPQASAADRCAMELAINTAQTILALPEEDVPMDHSEELTFIRAETLARQPRSHGSRLRSTACWPSRSATMKTVPAGLRRCLIFRCSMEPVPNSSLGLTS